MTAKPCAAIVAAIASMSVRLRVMPWLKITIGQPEAGLVLPEPAFGIVSSTGTVCTLLRTGTGFANVRLVEVGSSPSWLNGAIYAPGAACQNVVSTAVGFCADGASR